MAVKPVIEGPTSLTVAGVVLGRFRLATVKSKNIYIFTPGNWKCKFFSNEAKIGKML